MKEKEKEKRGDGGIMERAKLKSFPSEAHLPL